MPQENEMDPGKPHSEFPALEIYLQECDFSRLRERDWHRIGPADARDHSFPSSGTV